MFLSDEAVIDMLLKETPLADGRKVIDLVNTSEAGAVEATAILSTTGIADATELSLLAVRENAKAKGYNFNRAVADAAMSQMDIMQASMPTPPMLVQ